MFKFFMSFLFISNLYSSNYSEIKSLIKPGKYKIDILKLEVDGKDMTSETRKAMKTMPAQIKMIQEQMKNMPAAQQEMMKKMMKNFNANSKGMNPTQKIFCDKNDTFMRDQKGNPCQNVNVKKTSKNSFEISGFCDGSSFRGTMKVINSKKFQTDFSVEQKSGKTKTEVSHISSFESDC